MNERYSNDISKFSNPFPYAIDRVINAAWVNGKHIARFCAMEGNSSMGKKVPAKINIGLMNRKKGMLNQSIEGV